MNKNNILTELLNKQLKDVDPNKKLTYKDFVRILKNINSSLFCENFCSIWTGYVVNDTTGTKNNKIDKNIDNYSEKENKSSYINFYFKQKKVSLHRLLYINFIGPLQDNEYLKFSCRNRGKCCNITHLIKMSKEEKDKEKEEKMQKEKEELKRSFTIEFD
jgi:hypothetical protein